MNSKYKIYTFISLFLMLALGIFVTSAIIASTAAFYFLLILSAIGFINSWFNQDEDRMTYIRWLVGIISLIISLRLAIICAYQNKPIVIESLKSLMYLGVASSFTLLKLRDCYFLFLLSALLLIFSAVLSSMSPNLFLVYIMFFVVFCMIFIRSVAYQENTALISDYKGYTLLKEGDFLNNNLLNIIRLSLAIMVVTIPMYFFIPRFNIPLPLLPDLKYEQNKIFIDMIGTSFTSFFGRDKRKVIVGPHKLKEDSENLSGSNFKEDSKDSLIELGKDEMSPVFWHGLEAEAQGPENAKSKQKDIEEEIKDKRIDINNYDSLSKRLEDKIKNINEELINNQSDLASQKETERILSQRKDLIDKKIELEIRIQSLKEDIEDFSKLKNKAEDGLTEAETLRKQAELEDKITKFNKFINNSQWSLYKNKIYRQPLINKVRDNYQHLSKLADNALDKEKQNKLLLQLQALESDLEYSKIKKSMLSKQSEDLSRLYMHLEDVVVKKDDSFKEQAKQEETKERYNWLFFENNPLFINIGLSSLKVISWLSLIFILIIAIYFLSKLIKLFYLNIRKIRELNNLASHNPKIFMVGLYLFLLEILETLGYKCEKHLDATEYSYFIVGKIPNINEPFSSIARNFLEARYSSHNLSFDYAKKFRDDYRAVIREINKTVSLKKKILLRLRFPLRNVYFSNPGSQR